MDWIYSYSLPMHFRGYNQLQTMYKSPIIAKKKPIGCWLHFHRYNLIPMYWGYELTYGHIGILSLTKHDSSEYIIDPDHSYGFSTMFLTMKNDENGLVSTRKS